MHHLKKLLLLLALTGGCLTLASAAKVSERSREKEAAEAQRAELLRQLGTLQSTINRTEAESDQATEALGKSARAISEANRALHELDAEQVQTERKLKQLSDEQAGLAKRVSNQQTQLSRLLRGQYVAGNDDRIKLLLSGDNPNRINRDLEYLGYVSQAQATLISTLRGDLLAIERNKAEAEEAQRALADIVVEAREQRTALENEKASRATLLASLSTKLASQRKQASDLKRDDQRLSGLVSKLDELIEAQRKADAAAAEQRRLKQLADAQAEQARKQAQQDRKRARPAPNALASNPDAIDDDEPPKKLALRNELRPEAGVEGGNAGLNFGGLRGKLRLPVKGDIVTRFGAARGEGPDSKGLFIRAAEGTEIRVIAEGKVVFADWLRGFGNLLIVDHGNQYLTIYGNNQSVLKRPGDVVKSGDTIATAGNSGGNEQSGLYFEMRHQGRAFDPLGWVTTR
ncbi:murein hydrolase activator EnvC family protein [Actimicrobium sp. CCI2.3]|uniref:murein hydrolase activator EnvC family protein n=1 Tax=Actimicrobium sp. CCI2.3 TaxID=3048616 RepID=UPI002AB34375|nr:peptidoglycan DD-metalloendopeptidase family protein [Actimicrobium sp. CCI2.3]MDY7576384.1 peptidoglycan DD-metalloendopeptidase family protein [Actimicrobium sp. CCI2.3]MEB0020412.1 peptidoglycan DD-metalloendopeptidase family protein [Actimicrobium sp. CCI2.3]